MSRLMRKLLLGIFFLTTVISLGSTPSSSYFRAAAMPGDGIYSLLRRYQLDRHSCNFDRFYDLNQLKKNAPLIVGREYFLPILIYRFNGKTIRSSIGVENWELALRIQNYNEQMHANQLRQADFRSDLVLWVPYHELNCPNPDLNISSPTAEDPESAAGGNRIFPIFGKDYAHVPLASNKLRGKVFYIVGGHGGPDPGAIGRRGNYQLCEDEYAYDVALRVCRNLIAHGATAYMITRDLNDGIRNDKFLDCDTDEVVWGQDFIFRSQKARLTQRSDIINELYEKHLLQGVTQQSVIVIHVDSRSQSERTDVFFYHHPESPGGKELALKLHRIMRQKYRQFQKGRGYHGSVTGRDLHMLRETKPSSVYIELANIRNKFDQQRIILATNRQALADWLFEALLN